MKDDAFRKLIRTSPELSDSIRRNLTAARILSGMTAVEAAERLGYSNSTQLSLIEAGKRPVPCTIEFLRRAAEVYDVSLDFLSGLSPLTERDGKTLQHHALVRQVEATLSSVSAAFATALIEASDQTQPVARDFLSVVEATDRTVRAMDGVRARGFDDFPGSAPLLAAVEQLGSTIAPLRQKVSRLTSLAKYISDLQAGRAEPLQYLIERCHAETAETLIAEAAL